MRNPQVITTLATALLGSAAFAQTTTINLPADQASISGSLGASLGNPVVERFVVNVSDGGTVADNTTFGDGVELNISGGVVGTSFNITGDESSLTISGGTVGSLARVNADTLITGGVIGDGFGTFGGLLPDPTITIRGGSLGNGVNLSAGTVLNLEGGTIASGVNAIFDSTVNIRGGDAGDNFTALNNSEINIFGSDFALDGVSITGLELNNAFSITDRNVTLTGTLADGSGFSFDLNSDDSLAGSADVFESGASLNVTLVPEPASAALLLSGAAGLLYRRRR